MSDDAHDPGSESEPSAGSDAAATADAGDRPGVAARAADAEAIPDVPDWDDEYLDRVSDRLMFNFDLERDRRVRGERFDLFGRLRVESQKEFFHPALNYANHESREYLLAGRRESVRVADLERLVESGHALAEEWIDADEEHYGTEFSFVLVVPDVPEDVRAFVEGFRDRTLLKLGYFGRYEVNLAVVAPEREAIVASRNADVARAFALWEDSPPSCRRGPLGRLLDRLR